MKTIQEKNGGVEYVLTSEEYRLLQAEVEQLQHRIQGEFGYSEAVIKAQTEIAKLHEANQAMLAALKSFVTIANETHDHWDNDRDSKVGKMLLALSGENQRYDKRIDAIHAAIAKGEQA